MSVIIYPGTHNGPRNPHWGSIKMAKSEPPCLRDQIEVKSADPRIFDTRLGCWVLPPKVSAAPCPIEQVGQAWRLVDRARRTTIVRFFARERGDAGRFRRWYEDQNRYRPGDLKVVIA